MFNTVTELAKWTGLSLCVLQFVACGGTGQDAGQVSGFQQVFRGQAIDGYVARATVFVDTNNDGTRNPWEAFAFTDNQGYYSYNPLSATDYCAEDAAPQNAQYCLRVNVALNSVVIRVDRGYDVLTGEPFSGQLSRRIDASALQSAGPEEANLVISPLTSIVTSVENAADRDAVLASLGLRSEDLDVDYLNRDGNIDGALLASALKIHKTVTVLSDRITDHYTRIGEEVNTPNDATATVYSQLAQQLLANPALDFNTAINDTPALTNVLLATEQHMQQIYAAKDYDFPPQISAASVSRAVAISQGLNAVINALAATADAGSPESAGGMSKTLEALVIKALNEQGNDTSIDNALAFFTTGNSALTSSLVQAMSRHTADINALINHNFAPGTLQSEAQILALTQLPQDAAPFTTLAGKQLRIADLDLGSAPDNLKDSEVELYFSGDSGDLDGAFSACIKHIDGAKADGTLGEGNSRGERVTGFWSLLDHREGVGSYSLLITITFLGTTYQAIMKPAGSEVIGASQYQRIRFDSDGDIGIWHSLSGLQPLESLPSDDRDCRARLPSRVGI